MQQSYQCLPEVKYYNFYFYLFLILTLVISLPLFTLYFANGSEDTVYLGTAMLYFLILLPFDIYYYSQWNYFKKLKPTNIQITTLDQVEANFARSISFLVEMDFDGEKKRVSTLAIFQGGGFGPNNLSEYSMKKARVGYDPTHDIAVILELLAK